MNTNQSYEITENFSNWGDLFESLKSPGFDSNPLQEVIELQSSTHHHTEFLLQSPLNPLPNDINLNLSLPPDSPQPLVPSNTHNSDRSKPRKDKEKQKEVAVAPKKTTSTKSHASAEKKRRDRIKEKMETLEQITPHRGKLDKAGTIDTAVEHIRDLQKRKDEFCAMNPHLKEMTPLTTRFYNPQIPIFMSMMPYMGHGFVHPSMHPPYMPFYPQFHPAYWNFNQSQEQER